MPVPKYENVSFRARRDSYSSAHAPRVPVLTQWLSPPKLSIPTYGYILLTFTWTAFIITNVIIFDLVPVNWTIDREVGYRKYALYVFYLNFVILWIWCLISWISMKLFRHSKGSG